jgi:hypothetical protein
VIDRWLIIQPISDLSPFYQNVDFLIETFPLTGGTIRVEAMSFGLPIVGIENLEFSLLTDTGVFPQNYPLIAKDNTEFINYCSSLITNEGFRTQIAKANLKHFKENYDYEEIKSKIINIYEGNFRKIELLQDRLEDVNYNEEYTYLLSLAHSGRPITFMKIFLKTLKFINIFSFLEMISLFFNSFRFKENLFKVVDLLDAYLINILHTNKTP